MIGPVSSGACVGADGAATATGLSTTRYTGLLYALYVQCLGDDPATTDIIVRTKGISPAAPSTVLLSRANSSADGWYFPRADTHLASTGAALTTNDTLLPVDDNVEVFVDDANTDDVVNVWLYLV